MSSTTGTLWATVKESFLSKLLLAEVLLITFVLALLTIGGDFTRQSPTATGLLAAFLAAIALLLGILMIVFAVGTGVVRGYHSLARG